MSILELCFLASDECTFLNGKRVISKCHSVSKSKVLKEFAIKSHVQTILPDQKNNILDFIDQGIEQQASVFRGFCNEHDRISFSLLDNTDFDGSNEEYIRQLVFRSISLELWKKKNIIHQINEEMERPRYVPNMGMLTRDMNVLRYISKLKELVPYFELGTIELQQDFNRVYTQKPKLFTKCTTFNSLHDFACSSAVSIFFNKSDENIQIVRDGNGIERTKKVFLDIFPENERTVVVMSSFDDEIESINFINEFSWENEKLLKLELSQFIITHIENFFVSADYIPEHDRNRLRQIFNQFSARRNGWAQIHCPNLFVDILK